MSDEQKLAFTVPFQEHLQRLSLAAKGEVCLQMQGCRTGFVLNTDAGGDDHLEINTL